MEMTEVHPDNIYTDLTKWQTCYNTFKNENLFSSQPVRSYVFALASTNSSTTRKIQPYPMKK